MPASLASPIASSVDALGARAVRQQENGHERLAVLAGRDGAVLVLRSEVDRGRDRVTDRGPGVRLEAVDLVDDLGAVVRGLGERRRGGRERDEADTEPLGQPLDEPAGRVLRGGEPRRRDVGSHHRPGDVDRQDDARLVTRHGDRRLGPCERDEQCDERQQGKDGRDVPPPAGRAVDDVREQVEVREPHRVLHTPPLDEEVRHHQQRHDRQREKGEGPREAHRRLLLVERKPASMRSQSSSVRQRAVRDARATPARGRSRRGRPRPPRRTPCGSWPVAVSTAIRRPVSGSTSQRWPTSGSSCSRRSRTSIAVTSCRAASRSSGVRQSRGPRKSETMKTTPRWRATALARSRAAPSDVAPTCSVSGSCRAATRAPRRPCAPGATGP